MGIESSGVSLYLSWWLLKESCGVVVFFSLQSFISGRRKFKVSSPWLLNGLSSPYASSGLYCVSSKACCWYRWNLKYQRLKTKFLSHSHWDLLSVIWLSMWPFRGQTTFTLWLLLLLYPLSSWQLVNKTLPRYMWFLALWLTWVFTKVFCSHSIGKNWSHSPSTCQGCRGCEIWPQLARGRMKLWWSTSHVCHSSEDKISIRILSSIVGLPTFFWHNFSPVQPRFLLSFNPL